MCSLGLYQDNQGSSVSPKGNRHQAHHLYRGHSRHGRVGDSIERPLHRDHLPPGEPDICDKFPKITTRTNEGHRLSRIPVGLDPYRAEAPRGQD